MVDQLVVHRNPALDTTPLSAFDRIVARLAEVEGDLPVIPLHQGKTAFTTPVDLREWSSGEFDFPAHHDGPSAGCPALLRAVTARLREQVTPTVEIDQVQIVAGITHALATAFHSVLQAGDEVIVLSPQWLFANGLIRAAGGLPVELPWFNDPLRHPDHQLCAAVEATATSRTRAIYLNLPNNPTGATLSAQTLVDLVELARRRGWWIVADNAYEFYDFTGQAYTDLLAVPGGRDVVFGCYSFSKSYGMTGYRIGYLVSPPAMREAARKFALHSIYSVATCCQFAALSALCTSPAQVAANVEFVRRARDLTATELVVPAQPVQGGFYAFLDLSEWPFGTADFIDRCLSRGVSLAPGHVFGEHCADYARLCFAVVGHDELRRGIAVVNDVYDAVMGG